MDTNAMDRNAMDRDVMDTDKEGKRWRNLLGMASRPKAVVAATPCDVVHHENKWRLLRYRSGNVRFATPLLLVPSLINRHYVLDLQPGKSFVEYLVARGHDVWCIDWGTPQAEDRFVTLNDVADVWLGRAMRLCAQSSVRKQAHVLGYCMGGTLAAMHAAVHPNYVASLTLLAAPVRFGDAGSLAAMTRNSAFDIEVLTRAVGLVPARLLQASFQLLRPTLGLAKAVNLVDRAWNDRYLDGYFAMETWANDNVALPGAFYRTWIEEVYRRNGLWQGNLTLGAQLVDLQKISCPLLAVVFSQDAIAPAADCAAVLERIGSADKQLLDVAGSHVGGVTSRDASKTLWPALSAWWQARDGVRAKPQMNEGATDA